MEGGWGRCAWPTREGRWRKPAIVAASLGLHAVVMGYMAFQAIQEPRRYGDDVVRDGFTTPIYVQLEPRPLLDGEVARTRRNPALPDPISNPPNAGTRQVATTGATDPAFSENSPSPPAPRFAPEGLERPAVRWNVRPETPGDRIRRGLRTSSVGCANPRHLDLAERALCDARFSERAATARRIEGTGDPERDSRFARQGARELAAYAERREIQPRRPPCDKTGPVADCGVEVSVEIFSSTDGWFPNLQRED